jgi:hypothetical protein
VVVENVGRVVAGGGVGEGVGGVGKGGFGVGVGRGVVGRGGLEGVEVRMGGIKKRWI